MQEEVRLQDMTQKISHTNSSGLNKHNGSNACLLATSKITKHTEEMLHSKQCLRNESINQLKNHKEMEQKEIKSRIPKGNTTLQFTG